MKILHLSTSDSGGAGRSAYRIHQGLKRAGIDSYMLVQNKFNDDSSVLCPQTKLQKGATLLKLPERINRLPLALYPKRQGELLSPQWMPDFISSKVAKINPDIINLNWICRGYLQIETLAKLDKPLVWTLADMWPFTGGCFYTQGCDRYKSSCGNCPQLNSHKSSDLSHWVWQRKKKAWKDINLTIVASSTWLARCAKASSLFQDLPIEVIPCALDTSVYKPFNRVDARRALNLPQEKHLILFGALRATSDTRKGFHLLCSALKSLSEAGWREDAEVVIFGASEPVESIDLGFRTHYLGHLHDDLSLSLVYSSASVMTVPSMQEAFGQTASEAISCGTPVVAFDGTGITQIVDHLQNGYLSKPFEIEDLARGIAWVLEDNERHKKLCQYARNKAEKEFTLDKQAEQYSSLFNKILEQQETSYLKTY